MLWAIRWSTHEHEGRAALAPRLCAAREQVRKCLQRKASHRNATRAVATQRNASHRNASRSFRHAAMPRMRRPRCNRAQHAMNAFAAAPMRGTHAGASACKSCRRSMSVKRRLIARTIIGHPQPCGLQRGRNRQLQGTRASLSVCEFRLNGASHGCLSALFGA